ncbi:MAG TPA: tetratricopeptide repeat protein [Streptosporangiaceae bacterium]|jgi:tetratricopeptide (TPR) repeat protein
MPGEQHALAVAALADPAAHAARPELVLAREIRARELVIGLPPAGIAAAIMAECGPRFGTRRIRACRLALGIALADVVAQIRARYAAEGRREPRFSETLLSAYESGHKRPGPEYLHYVCATYQVDPADLGYEGPCLCGQSHRLAAPGGPDAPGGVRRLAGPHAIAAPDELAVPDSEGHAAGPAVTAIPRQRGTAAQAESADPPGLADPAVLADSAGEGAGGAGGSDDDQLRRMLIRLMADAGTQVDCGFLGAVDRLRRRMDEALLGGTVSAAMIDRWEETTAGYARQYMRLPPLRLLCDALLDFGDVRRMCEQRQPLEFGERLCRVAGQLAGLAGIVLLDLGDQRLARSFFRTARTAIDETGDRKLRAWVAAREALVPLYYSDPQEAAALAGSAMDMAGRQPCVAGVMAPVVEARAQARLARLTRRRGRELRGVLDRVRGALDRSYDALGELTDDQTGDTAFGYTERQLSFHAGDALAMLGDHQEAQRCFARALRLYPAAEVLDTALVSFGQARCLADADEPEQALRLAADALLRLPREQHAEIIMQAARGLDALAARHAGLPAARDFREVLRGTGAVAAPG